MRQQFSNITIRKPDTCSAGASNPYSITQWDRCRFQETTARGDEPNDWLALDLTAESSIPVYIAKPEVAGYRPDDKEWAILLVCHWLVDRIPREGLVELAESLGSIYSFYQTRNLPARHLLPSKTRVKAVVRDAMERPPFELEISEG